MGAILAAAAGFPAIVFTAALVVVVVFWLLVAVRVTDSGSFDADADVDAWGMGGVPVTVAFSAMTVLAWIVSVTGTVLLDPVASPGMDRALIRLAVLAAALLIAWRGARVLVRPLHRLFPDEPDSSRADFIGLVCAVRTEPVDTESGPSEAVAQDDSTSAIGGGPPGAEPPPYGRTAPLCAYDDTGEYFRVTPHHAALAPRGHAA
ncbi:hypothetical protein AB0952_03480 [Streptomyces caniferus]|uniref:hypothetical protein n=1 Tax=Streptomyces caniferus TaxID=285557 RepID=UPI003455CA72